MTDTADIVVVGGGMAGLSIGAELAGKGHAVLVLEAEEAPGYHASGRSVAFWMESYGGPLVQPLTTASGPLLAAPMAEFSEAPFVHRRGVINVGRADDATTAAAFQRTFSAQGVALECLDRAALEATIPGLRPDWVLGIAEPSTADIDAAALLGAYRKTLLRSGGVLACDRAFVAARRVGEGWHVETAGGPVSCGVLVNAAGAWADNVAKASGVAPIGVAPLRRTVVQLRVGAAYGEDAPIIVGLDGGFYFKSLGNGRLWLSPHDEEPDEPGDAAPDELGVATAIDRFEHVVDWPVLALEHKWAGLRSFAPDRAPVYGHDPLARGFFWFAGQGGFGIQTAPAAALLGAALLTGDAPDARIAHIDARPYSADRFAL